ncbi:DUF6184 family natural product biosynthesis lipoprotein [Cystobacter ferrugineus]|uniref:Lipoprotein n=1 Tax=Cystobacter ferrugineus TaxID=83449 RepID=A0A1L9AWW4_9BACT|nr:DUF6184 family natural product biosynthesis lipoprotein [Cystobacter ferrugineus]OJH34502.1 hypothetical protein BON30_42590 [Cystobacter ferrugineus]
MRISSSLFPLSLLLVLPACGPTSREDAQSQATRAACDYYDKCEKIGSGDGKQFQDWNECEVKTRDFFQTAWTADNCLAINETGLETCLKRIPTTGCGSATDFLNTAILVCGAGSVCQDVQE